MASGRIAAATYLMNTHGNVHGNVSEKSTSLGFPKVNWLRLTGEMDTSVIVSK